MLLLARRICTIFFLRCFSMRCFWLAQLSRWAGGGSGWALSALAACGIVRTMGRSHQAGPSGHMGRRAGSVTFSKRSISKGEISSAEIARDLPPAAAPAAGDDDDAVELPRCVTAM